MAKVVYDVEKESPHYKNMVEFLEPQNQIRITKTTANGRPLENLKNSVKNRYWKTLKPWYLPYKASTNNSKPIDDDVLIFESRFESGNLKKAIQVDRSEYELVLKPDYNTKNFTQWFYFQISNTRKYREYTFHIINFVKPDSQFNDGMMPLFYSTADAKKHNIGWYRAGYDISYYQNNQPFCKVYGDNTNDKNVPGKFTSLNTGVPAQKEPSSLYTLSFKVSFKNDHDTVYVAMCYPYTYTDCQNFLDKICDPPEM